MDGVVPIGPPERTWGGGFLAAFGLGLGLVAAHTAWRAGSSLPLLVTGPIGLLFLLLGTWLLLQRQLLVVEGRAVHLESRALGWRLGRSTPLDGGAGEPTIAVRAAAGQHHVDALREGELVARLASFREARPARIVARDLRRLLALARPSEASQAAWTIESRPLRGATCPFCRLELDAEVAACRACETRYHAECAEELGRCGTIGCAHGESARGRERA